MRASSLEVLRVHDGHWLTVGMHVDDELVRAEPFAAIELALGALWRDFAPPSHAAEGTAAYDIW